MYCQDWITFEKVEKSTFQNVGQLEVEPDQVRYVCDDLEEFVHSWQLDDAIDCYLILLNGTPVGFFALDFSFDRHRSYLTCSEGFAVLRCFFIDRRFQNRGLAKGTLHNLNSVVSAYSKCRQVYLTVNLKNKAAISVYESCGFEAVEDLYMGGAAGPQLVMVKNLNR